MKKYSLAIVMLMTIFLFGCKSTTQEGTFEKIGVGVCNEYVEKYEKCLVDNIPQDVRQPLVDKVHDQLEIWQEEMKNKDKKQEVENECKNAIEFAKKDLEAYSCEF